MWQNKIRRIVKSVAHSHFLTVWRPFRVKRFSFSLEKRKTCKVHISISWTKQNARSDRLSDLNNRRHVFSQKNVGIVDGVAWKSYQAIKNWEWNRCPRLRVKNLWSKRIFPRKKWTSCMNRSLCYYPRSAITSRSLCLGRKFWDSAWLSMANRFCGTSNFS